MNVGDTYTMIARQNFCSGYLNDLLSSHIYEGLQSMYNEATNIEKDNANVLKCFQTFLKKIPTWNEQTLENETERIIKQSKNIEVLTQLVHASIKTTFDMITGMKSNSESETMKKIYDNINFSKFVHKVYIECARELWNNPFLMYHNYPPLELKRNKKDTINLIEKSISNVIKQLLPFEIILDLINNESRFERNESQTQNSEPMQYGGIRDTPPHGILSHDTLSRDIKSDTQNTHYTNNTQHTKSDTQNTYYTNNTQQTNDTQNTYYTNNTQQTKSDTQNTYHTNNTHNSLHETNTKQDTQNTKSETNIIQHNEPELSKKELSNKILEILHKSSEKKGGSNNKSMKSSRRESRNNSESDLETSLSYKPEKSEKNYQEIFSNKNNNKPSNTKSGKTFFNKYLNI